MKINNNLNDNIFNNLETNKMRVYNTETKSNPELNLSSGLDNIEISEEAIRLFQNMELENNEIILNLIENFLNTDYNEQINLNYATIVSKHESFNPEIPESSDLLIYPENNIHIAGVKYKFNQKSLENFIYKELLDKINNPLRLSNMISKGIMETIFNPLATPEERENNRENIFHLIDRIINTYFDDEESSNNLLLEIKRYVEFDKFLENNMTYDKGYVVKNFQVFDVEYSFEEKTLESFIFDMLLDKVDNPSELTSKISKDIRGTIYNPDLSIKKRASFRKDALELAEEIANDFFEDDEAIEFLLEIRRYAENDILREKGYIVFDNSDMEPFKNYTLPSAPKNYVRGKALAKKYGETDLKFILDDAVKYKDFVINLQIYGEKWAKEIIEEFDIREKQIQAIINKAKPSRLIKRIRRLIMIILL